MPEPSRPVPSIEPAPRRMATVVVLGLVVAAGVVARMVQAAQRRSLFIDDVQLVLNVAVRDFITAD